MSKGSKVKFSDELLNRQLSIIETFLYEFCDVHSIAERDLKDHVYVVGTPELLSIEIVNEQTKDVEFGVKAVTGETLLLQIFGKYHEHTAEYPKTTDLITALMYR